MKDLIGKDRRVIIGKARRLMFTNPFSAERSLLDADILKRGTAAAPAPSWDRARDTHHEIAQQIAFVTRRELEAVPKERRAEILSNADEDSFLLRDVIYFLLFYEFYERMDELIERSLTDPGIYKKPVAFFSAFESEAGRWFEIRDNAREAGIETKQNLVIDRHWVARIFSVCYQLRRAYYFVYYKIVGTSPSMMRVREAIWDAIFTRNLEWYWRYMLGRMADFSTLITGPTGSGKEQIAQAICRSQYIPFDPDKRRFESDDRELFLPINLAALSPTLIESELFGHRKGAFTGALEGRQGLMESCSAFGAVFLDEIGELAPELQVKLLRVLQSRTFHPLGDREARTFDGRIVSATNQVIPDLIRKGLMREDFYYRLNACQIEAPSLARRFEESPEEITQLVTFLMRRMLGTEHADLEEIAISAVADATKRGRAWRGNVRELEQFLRRQLSGAPQESDPLAAADIGDDPDNWLARAARAELTLEELTTRYCDLARRKHGTWEKTAEVLGADWRTVRKWADKAE